MTTAIVPLSPGERPTSGGFYAVRDQHNSISVVFVHQLVLSDYTPEFQYVLYPGSPERVSWDGLDFIARIFPDRIEGREG